MQRRRCAQRLGVCEACVITSPGSRGYAAPAVHPHMHSGWNSNNPKSSSMEFQRARGRRINHRRREAVTQEGQEKTGQKEGGGGFENNSSRSPRLFGPLRLLWQSVRYSTLPKMAAPLGSSCRKLLWESCRHRYTSGALGST